MVASVVQMLLIVPGYSDTGDLQIGSYAVAFAISLVVAVLLFMLVVPRAGAVTAIVLGVVAIVTVVAFWLGITLPIAAAAVLVGVRERTAGRQVGMATGGAVLGPDRRDLDGCRHHQRRHPVSSMEHNDSTRSVHVPVAEEGSGDRIGTRCTTVPIPTHQRYAC